MKRKGKLLSVVHAFILCLCLILWDPFCCLAQDNVDYGITEDAKTDMVIHFLDVGQGLSVLVQAAGQTLLYDGGGRATSDFVVAYLKHQNVEKIDYMIASHYDEDHLAGLIGCLNVFEVEHVFCPDYEADTAIFESFQYALEKKGVQAYYPSPGEKYSFGIDSFTVWTPDDLYEEENNNSIVIRVQNGNNHVLLMGDAQFESEDEMLSYGNEVQSDILCVGHHGSNNSTSAAFLQEVAPDYAVISCGRENSYGHPGDELLARLQQQNTMIYRTDLQGTVIAMSDGDIFSWNVEPWDIANTVDATDYSELSGAHYILNVKSYKIHYPSCKSVKKMAEHNKKEYSGSLDDLLEMGYEACQNCNPQ